jgi:hypothetical protein
MNIFFLAVAPVYKAKHVNKSESFNILISSGTDARKKPVTLHVRKVSLLGVITAVLVFIAACTGIGFMLLSKDTQYTNEIYSIQKNLDVQNGQIEQYTKEMDSLRQQTEGPSAQPS